jgi:ParB/RepB/Spo0J family partition protein
MNTTTVTNATEYRDLPLAMLTESTTNPRRLFEENALKELADTIRSQGVLSPLLVRPTSERSFEIVFGARRYRAAQMAEVVTVPVRIKNLTDAEVLEAQLIENLQRRDVHSMEEANGFRALLNLEEPKYSIEQIAAKTGKSPVYVTTLCGQPHKVVYVGNLLMWRSGVDPGVRVDWNKKNCGQNCHRRRDSLVLPLVMSAASLLGRDSKC